MSEAATIEMPVEAQVSDKVVITIEFDRTTGVVQVGGEYWEWGRDEALCDWMLKKAADQETFCRQIDREDKNASVGIEFTRSRRYVLVEVSGLDRMEDEALFDWLLKKAARTVEIQAQRLANQTTQQNPNLIPDAEERSKLLRSLRSGV